MPEQCSKCGDSGLQIVIRDDGARVARPCICREVKRLKKHLSAAQIPDRFRNCTFETFDTKFNLADSSLSIALLQARKFVNTYPLETQGKGLLFVGRPGLGKTHLAVATLRKLMEERGAQGLFVDYRDLLKQIQHSYNSGVLTTELEILKPIFESEFLVIDDLGASKASDWVFDTVAHILNSRYNRQLSTIMTTNFANQPETPYEIWSHLSIEQRSNRPNTLGDQIGDRVLSRLHEMCVIVEVQGIDVRRTYKRAHFAKVPDGGWFAQNLSDATAMREAGLSLKKEITTEALGELPVPQSEEEEVVGWKRLGRLSAHNHHNRESTD